MAGLAWQDIKAEFKPVQPIQRESGLSSIGDGLRAFASKLEQQEERAQGLARMQAMTNAYNNYADAIREVSNSLQTPPQPTGNGLVGKTMPNETPSPVTAPTASNPTYPQRIYTGLPDAQTIERAKQFLPMFQRASQATGIPVPQLMAFAQTESNFNPRAVSHTGVRGIMQVTEPNYREVGMVPGDRFDPEQSIMAGAKWIQKYLNSKHIDGDWDKMYTFYNGGYHGLSGIYDNDWKSFANNPAKQKEVRNYAPKMQKNVALWTNWLNQNPQLLAGM